MPLNDQDAQNESDRPTRRWLLWLGVLAAIPLLGVALAVVEYQTNWTTDWIGGYLIQTNSVRRTSGSVWSRLTSEDQARDAIVLNELPTDVESGLPAVVSQGTYSLERIPPSGLPTFVALEYRRSSNATRDTRGLIADHRIFAIGQRLLADVRFEITVPDSSVVIEARRTLELAGGLTTSPDDTTHIDSLRVDIERAVSDVIRERRLEEEADRIRTGYLTGQVNQIFLNQMMGAYRGELYEDGEASPLTFTIATDSVAAIFNVILEDRGNR